MKPFLQSLAAALFLSLTAFASAQTVAPDPAPTIITTVPYTISKPGLYQLGANLAGTATSGNLITIAADNVTLDFAGHYITGPANPASTVYGVYALEHNNLTIQNGKISFCEIGIYLLGNTSTSNNLSQRIQNMVIAHSFYLGINLYNASNCDVLNNRICYTGGTSLQTSAVGVSILGDGIRVSNNEIYDVTISQLSAESGGSAVGVGASATTYSTGNTLTNCANSIVGGKYQNNLIGNCGSVFRGTDAGGNY